MQGSGAITYDELCEVVRHKLRVPRAKLSEVAVKSLWCALDTDDSNQLTMSEFGKFLKLGDKPQLKKLQSWGSSGTGAKSLSDMSAINQAIESTPTATMRTELASAGVALSNADLRTLCAQFKRWIEAFRYSEGKQKSHSWANIFADLDMDVCAATPPHPVSAPARLPQALKATPATPLQRSCNTPATPLTLAAMPHTCCRALAPSRSTSGGVSSDHV